MRQTLDLTESAYFQETDDTSRRRGFHSTYQISLMLGQTRDLWMSHRTHRCHNTLLVSENMALRPLKGFSHPLAN